MGDRGPLETEPSAALLSRLTAIRPELHRYCARMMGSVIDGEDVVQDTLLKALAAPRPESIERIDAWLFRLAHNQAIDRWRSYEQRMRAPLEIEDERPDTSVRGAPADEQLVREQAVRAAVGRFLELPPLQRSCVVLKDVLEHSLEEIAASLETTVPAVQAAVHRGRRRLAELQRMDPEPEPERAPPSPQMVHYASLFNAHDWDGLRGLLADDVRLDVVTRLNKRGRSEVGSYFGRYAQMPHWRVAPAWLEGREVLAVSRGDEEPIAYVIAIEFDGEQVVSIRDFHHVPYVVRDARIVLA